MSLWKDEADFMKDIEQLSEFYISGNHNNPDKKFIINSNKRYEPVNRSWYESESEEEADTAGQELDHLDVMRGIQQQVRSVVGNHYNNDVLESYYNVCKDDAPDATAEAPSCAPKEISIIYAKEQNLKNSLNEPVLLVKRNI